MEERKKLWHDVFGDDYAVIDTFFDTFYSPELCAAEYVDGKLCAAAYVLPVGELVTEKMREKCAHIYAVAVYPAYRGRGFGVTVTNKAVQLAKKAGFTAIVLHPADEGLYEFYEKHCGFKTAFYTDKREHDADGLQEVSTHDYRIRREELLAARDHIALNERALAYFVKTGGVLFADEHHCAATDGGRICEFIGEAEHGEFLPSGMIFGEKILKKAHFGLNFD